MTGPRLGGVVLGAQHLDVAFRNERTGSNF
jgi:hypothetical protein